MRRHLPLLCILLSTGLGTIAAIGTAQAESQEISIDVPFSAEATEVEGIIFGSTGVQTIANATSEVVGNTVVVTFSYDDELVTQDAMASAVAKSADGVYSFGIVKALDGNGYSDSSQLLPICEIETPSAGLLRSQLSTLRQLVKVRSELRTEKKAQLNALLTEQRLALIASAEKAFHTVPTEYVSDLSPSLPATELSDRLGRLLAAVQHYRIEKQRETARTGTEETS
jgi:hypothetical protein